MAVIILGMPIVVMVIVVVVVIMAHRVTAFPIVLPHPLQNQNIRKVYAVFA
jgi:hypothetical protein